MGLVETEAAGDSDEGTIDHIMLNACETEEMGKKLRAVGIRHAVCLRSEVDDRTAREFALNFYQSLDVSLSKHYSLAFRHAVARMASSESGAQHVRP